MCEKSPIWMILVGVWRLMLWLIYTAASFVIDDLSLKPRYVALKAHQLHEEGLISDAEYTQSLHDDPPQ